MCHLRKFDPHSPHRPWPPRFMVAIDIKLTENPSNLVTLGHLIRQQLKFISNMNTMH